MHEHTLPSSLDDTLQPSLFEPANGVEPQPLLVGLHTWSADRFNQESKLLPLAQQYNWHLLLPEFRGPNLVTNPHVREAAGSVLAKQDVLDVIAYIQSQHEVSEIFLLGGSGGGHMALQLAAYSPQTWSAVSAWCPITDLALWHRQNTGYAHHIAACCGGEPGISPEIDAEFETRSPISQLAALAQGTISIHHGKHDITVPFGHTLELYNRLLADYPEAKVYCEIFDGGHQILHERALSWFLSIQRAKRENEIESNRLTG
jgi:pimeloyl-ACP methyl ester carboxylesterase